MENNIKKIYTTLSGGKLVMSDEYIITSSDFSSVMFDRFVAELSKNGIKWNGESIPFSKLLANEAAPSPANNCTPAHLSATPSRPPANGFAVGIDLQNANELPACKDYWEDPFYKMKFKPEEIAYCVGKDDPRQSFAGIYACKEALVKCYNGLQWHDIRISYDDNGKPGYDGYFISISHSSQMAVAVAIKNETNFSAADAKPAPPISTAAADEQNIPAGKPKNFNRYFALAILVIVVYIVIRDFILR